MVNNRDYYLELTLYISTRFSKLHLQKKPINLLITQMYKCTNHDSMLILKCKGYDQALRQQALNQDRFGQGWVKGGTSPELRLGRLRGLPDRARP